MEKNGHIDCLNRTKQEERKELQSHPLFRVESCPPWLRFNKYILDGYRCHLSTDQCVESLFYIHNETVNIYSHGKFPSCEQSFVLSKVLRSEKRGIHYRTRFITKY